MKYKPLAFMIYKPKFYLSRAILFTYEVFTDTVYLNPLSDEYTPECGD